MNGGCIGIMLKKDTGLRRKPPSPTEYIPETGLPRELYTAPTEMGAQIEAELTSLDRKPFSRILADFIESSPSRRAISDLAEKAPDRWSSALSVAAKLAGYNDKLEITARRADELSDSEIESKINELVQAELAKRDRAMRADTLNAQVIDITPATNRDAPPADH
jgi:hypothetical protein